eukprot:3308415-Rhodomonas_salina.3
MACRGMKAHFASISGTLGQSDNLLNIPIITTIIALSSISLRSPPVVRDTVVLWLASVDDDRFASARHTCTQTHTDTHRHTQTQRARERERERERESEREKEL